MRIVFFLLLGLIGLSPLLLLLEGPMIHGLLIAYAAIMVGLIGKSIQPGEAGHLVRLIRPVATVACIIAFWMLFQTVPIPVKSWAHPIWSSAESALGRSIIGSITIDPGMTLIAFSRYCSAIAILFVVTAISIDRTRAEWVLFWLVGAASFVAIAQLIYNSFGFIIANEATDAGIKASATSVSALGVIAAAAAVLRAIERYEGRRTRPNASHDLLIGALGLPLAAFVICSITLSLFASGAVIFATAAGFILLGILAIARRLGLGLWVGGTLAAIVIVVVVAIAGSTAGSSDLTVRFGPHTGSSLILIQRMIDDTSFFGTGAGTFSSLLPIYQDADSIAAGMVVPTSAAQIVIELGKPAFWVLIGVAIIASLLLGRGAFRRGRDSYYPAAGAACGLMLTLEAFCDGSLLSTAVIICAATALGLGLAQSVSRSN